jgi:hypothetical protein
VRPTEGLNILLLAGSFAWYIATMDKSLRKAKQYVFNLINYNGRVPLYVLTRDSCSEISRLLGQWFYKKLPKVKIYVYKGKAQGRFHDLLLVDEGRVYVVDPTVWQFFKHKKSIIIAMADSMDDALIALSHYYGGRWKLSKTIKKFSVKEMATLKSILQKNLIR